MNMLEFSIFIQCNAFTPESMIYRNFVRDNTRHTTKVKKLDMS